MKKSLITGQKPPNKREPKRIKFCLQKTNIDCFISKSMKNEKNLIRDFFDEARKRGCQGNNHLREEKKHHDIKELKENRLDLKLNLSQKSVHQPTLKDNDTFFNNQLLMLQYGDQQVYIDSTNKHIRSKELTNESVEENDQETQELISSCIRVITEETTHTENPLSARGTPGRIQPQSYETQWGSIQIKPQQLFTEVPQEQKKPYTIDVDRVLLDGRTTIMVRNIPNKYTEALLIELFSENHRKKFDFMYLPIDPKNNCNVGYAFVNFIHAKFITDFYEEFHNKKWELFNSEKICQVCYARIQGTSQLTNHFEHSNMHYRERRGKYAMNDYLQRPIYPQY